MCEGESWTFVRTIDVSLPVKNNTDSMNQLVRYMFLPGGRSMSQGILDMCRDHRCLTTCQKQHRQNESAGQVDDSTRVVVRVIGDPRHMY